ncbi:uncharacterized protein METZ01_LOCUS279876, partial [marine metagenome]
MQKQIQSRVSVLLAITAIGIFATFVGGQSATAAA